MSSLITEAKNAIKKQGGLLKAIKTAKQQLAGNIMLYCDQKIEGEIIHTITQQGWHLQSIRNNPRDQQLNMSLPMRMHRYNRKPNLTPYSDAPLLYPKTEGPYDLFVFTPKQLRDSLEDELYRIGYERGRGGRMAFGFTHYTKEVGG